MRYGRRRDRRKEDGMNKGRGKKGEKEKIRR